MVIVVGALHAVIACRVKGFFCYAETWQQTMRRLAAGADAVLMDLRSFAPDNQGCRYEIEQLPEGIDSPRVLLVVDRTSDRAFLETALRTAWLRVGRRELPAAGTETRNCGGCSSIGRSETTCPCC